MKLSILAFLSILLACSPITIKAQTLLSKTEFERLLTKSNKATNQYTETFKNLSAEETKTFEDYDKNGKLKETRRIKSEFIVYQSPSGINEFRNVKEFNGTAITRSQKEIENAFDKLTNAGSETNESKLLKKEALRFDGKSSAWGMTLWQESPFGKLQPFFDFTLIGKENIDGHEVFVIEYRQTKPTLLLKFNPTEKDWKKEPAGREYRTTVSSGLRPENARQEGKIWIDAKSAQIRRNELKVFLQPAQLSKPVLALELNYEYQSSKFNILVPKKFTYTFYKISGSNDKNLSITKERTMLFEYSNFKEFKAEAKSYKAADQN